MTSGTETKTNVQNGIPTTTEQEALKPDLERKRLNTAAKANKRDKKRHYMRTTLV
jgi:hypothetical protein